MIIYQEKPCSKCKQSKPLDEFYKRSGTKNGKQAQCKECQKRHRETNEFKELQQKSRATTEYKETQANGKLLRLYGITLEEYNIMFDKQKGLCCGCQRPQSEFKRKFAVDHCHITGELRGLLCTNCNIVLGNAYDSKETLLRLVDYLTKY